MLNFACVLLVLLLGLNQPKKKKASLFFKNLRLKKTKNFFMGLINFIKIKFNLGTLLSLIFSKGKNLVCGQRKVETGVKHNDFNRTVVKAKIINFKQISTFYENNILNPWFVTGLIDAEGCFNISISKSLKKSKLGWVVQVRFIVELHLKDLALIRNLQSFFGGIGTITTTAKVARFSIVGLNDIINFVLPHFDNFPLQSVKWIEFKLWRSCVIIMKNKGHLTLEGIKEIFALKSALNYGLS